MAATMTSTTEARMSAQRPLLPALLSLLLIRP